jgi:hypothetical protein
MDDKFHFYMFLLTKYHSIILLIGKSKCILILGVDLIVRFLKKSTSSPDLPQMPGRIKFSLPWTQDIFFMWGEVSPSLTYVHSILQRMFLVPQMSKPSKSCLVPHRKRLLRRRGVGFDHLTTQSTQNKLGQMGENRISESEKRLTIFTREMTTTSSDSDNVDSPPLIFVKKFKLVYTRN